MRLLFINQYFPPDASATAHLLGELTEDLVHQNDVAVVAGRPSYNPEVGAPRPSGVQVLESWSTSFSRATMAGRLCNYLSFFSSSLIKALTAERPTVVVTMTDPPFIPLLGWLASVRYRCPHIIIHQDVFPDIAVALGKMRNRQAIASWRWMNGFVRKRAARLVVVGRDMLARLKDQGIPEEKLAYLPNWSAPQETSSTNVDRIRESQGWSERFVIMHAGNVGIAQNLSIVVEAADLLRSDPRLLFVFVGDGASKATLQREVERRHLESVEFLPYREKSQAQELMAAADAHLISLAPGLYGCASPSKLYGILATGRPAVAAVEKGTEVALTLQEFDCGIVTDPTPNALAEAVSKMKGSQLDEMGKRGLKALDERFRRDFITSQYGALLGEVANS